MSKTVQHKRLRLSNLKVPVLRRFAKALPKEEEASEEPPEVRFPQPKESEEDIAAQHAVYPHPSTAPKPQRSEPMPSPHASKPTPPKAPSRARPHRDEYQAIEDDAREVEEGFARREEEEQERRNALVDNNRGFSVPVTQSVDEGRMWVGGGFGVLSTTGINIRSVKPNENGVNTLEGWIETIQARSRKRSEKNNREVATIYLSDQSNNLEACENLLRRAWALSANREQNLKLTNRVAVSGTGVSANTRIQILQVLMDKLKEEGYLSDDGSLDFSRDLEGGQKSLPKQGTKGRQWGKWSKPGARRVGKIPHLAHEHGHGTGERRSGHGEKAIEGEEPETSPQEPPEARFPQPEVFTPEEIEEQHQRYPHPSTAPKRQPLKPPTLPSREEATESEVPLSWSELNRRTGEAVGEHFRRERETNYGFNFTAPVKENVNHYRSQYHQGFANTVIGYEDPKEHTDVAEIVIGARGTGEGTGRDQKVERFVTLFRIKPSDLDLPNCENLLRRAWKVISEEGQVLKISRNPSNYLSTILGDQYYKNVASHIGILLDKLEEEGYYNPETQVLDFARDAQKALRRYRRKAFDTPLPPPEGENIPQTPPQRRGAPKVTPQRPIPPQLPPRNQGRRSRSQQAQPSVAQETVPEPPPAPPSPRTPTVEASRVNYRPSDTIEISRTVGILQGTYDPDPDNPRSDPVEVYRWLDRKSVV